ncbi:MAG: subfamily B ATP-binding cassette protein MsbA [Halioglobus sp.]|jgi:subfamily B ATP-binding cassette protein MsbA
MSISRSNGLEDTKLYWRLLSFVHHCWFFVLCSMLGFVVYSMATVLLADLLQFLLDSLNASEQRAGGFIAQIVYQIKGTSEVSPLQLAQIAVPVAILVLTATRAVGYFAGTYALNLVSHNLVHNLRCALFDKILLAPGSYYESHSQGVLVSKLTFNVEQVTEAASTALGTLLRESLLVVGLLGYMLYLNWRLCLVFMLVGPILALVVHIVGQRFRRYSHRIQSSMGDVTQVSGESISAYREIRLFAGQSRQRDRFRKASDSNRMQSLKMAFANALSVPVLQTLLAASLALMVWLALSPAVIDSFTAGSLVAFLTAATQVGKPIRQLSAVQSVLQRGLAAAEDIFAQLDQEVESNTGTIQVDRAVGGLSFENVSFSYPDAHTSALSDISLKIDAGETVALVGRSGGGKTTLAKLLARFYAVKNGRILLDGVPIDDYELSNLRSQFAMVSQNVPLFHDTVYNNIAFGELAACSEEQVQHAVQSAYAIDFIGDLPDGIQTLLGEEGEGLSGGQRQRIAIARAILKNAPVLILDEATSALDYQSEHHIQQALLGVMARCTTIVIAHRLSTIERADRIVVLDEGRIVASGTHEELLERGGLYTQLYNQDFVDS